jgi:tRNA(Ile)-lysidine synthase
MKIQIEPGPYIVAVSGGVDSVVLLHLLAAVPDTKLTVAHFDHGIREDSAEDRRFVADLAKSYRLPFLYDRGDLGSDVGEASARDARYAFLRRARQAAGARAIVTAHHKDDVLETAVLNIIRGTGRRGLSSLQSMDGIRRPLLHVPKHEIVRYARDNQFLWREDSTNASDDYRRNYVRHKILPRFDADNREQLHDYVVALRQRNAEIDRLIAGLLEEMTRDGRIDRRQLIRLPHAVAREAVAAWLRMAGVGDIDRKLIEKLVWAGKTFRAGQRVSINRNYYLIVGKNDLALVTIER